MKLPSFRHVLGSLRILKRRSTELGQPGLAVWTRAGEAVAHDVSRTVSALAHQNECTQRELADRIRDIVADRKVTPQELAQLQRMPAALITGAERSHDIGEVIQL